MNLFTDHELELISDSIDLELDSFPFLDGSPRAAMLKKIQEKIKAQLNRPSLPSR